MGLQRVKNVDRADNLPEEQFTTLHDRRLVRKRCNRAFPGVSFPHVHRMLSLALESEGLFYFLFLFLAKPLALDSHFPTN